MEMESRCPLIINIVTQMEGGGAQKAAIQMCENFNKRGFRSEVWFLYKKRATYESYANTRWILDRRPKKFGEVLHLFRTLWTWLREANPIGVITYTHYANVIGQLTAWAVGVRYRLATQRNPSWSYPTGARLMDALFGSIGIYTANIFVSKSVEKSFANYPKSYKARSCVALNGLKKPIPTISKAEARQKFGLPQDAFIIINLGRLAFQKNQELLIRVIAEIPNEKVVLVIAGDGELHEQLYSLACEKQVIDRVFLLGELLPTQIPNFLISGDIAAFPSRYEAFGFALVEAMMVGLPVIVSDIEAHREIVGDAGIFLPLDDTEAWTQCFLRLMGDPSLVRHLAERAQLRAQLYDLEQMVDAYLRALLESDRAHSRAQI